MVTRDIEKMKKDLELGHERFKEKENQNLKKVAYSFIGLFLVIIIANIDKYTGYQYPQYLPTIFAILGLILFFSFLYHLSLQKLTKEEIGFQLYKAFEERGTKKSQTHIKKALFIIEDTMAKLEKTIFAEKLNQEINRFHDCLKNCIYPNATKKENVDEEKWESIIRISYKLVNEEGFPKISKEELEKIERDFGREEQIRKVFRIWRLIKKVCGLYNENIFFRALFWAPILGILFFYVLDNELSTFESWVLWIAAESLFTAIFKK